MIKRIVFWKVIGDSPAIKNKNSLLIKHLLESLSGKIPGMLGLEVAVNESQSSDASDLVFIANFKDHQSLLDYNDHPEHSRIKPNVSGLVFDRRIVAYETKD